jgi:hypothetical protein
LLQKKSAALKAEQGTFPKDFGDDSGDPLKKAKLLQAAEKDRPLPLPHPVYKDIKKNKIGIWQLGG